jgi:hypothetical protein
MQAKPGVHVAPPGSGRSVANDLLLRVLRIEEVAMMNMFAPILRVSLATMSKVCLIHATRNSSSLNRAHSGS